MSKKNSKKPAASAAVEVVQKPTLEQLLSGKGEAVQKAVAEKTAALLIAVAPADSGKGPKIKMHKPDVSPAKAVVKENKKAEKAAKKGTAKKEEKGETVAAFMRRLIGEGKSNEEVFTAAQKVYSIGEEKKHYPSWYRCEMKRKAAAEKPAAKTPAKKEKAASKKELPVVKKVPTKKLAKA